VKILATAIVVSALKVRFIICCFSILIN
jgi:hypothetical protein